MAATICEHTLANGLKLIGEVNPSNKSVGLGFFVKTGARDETPKESGISHFLEHMMFKGTAKREALDISYELGNLGVQANAYTSEEHTVYYGAVLSEYFSGFQELLSDMLKPSLVTHEFDMEKKVILEEIALYQDRPHFYLFENGLQDYYGSHSAGNSVLGTTQSVSAISRDAMKAYFDRRYVPDNMVLVASGNFDWDKFVSDSEKYCDSWQSKIAEREIKDFTGQELKKEYHKDNLSQHHLLFVTTGPSAQEEERYAFALLSRVLGDGSGSKLYWELVDKGLAESAVTELDNRDGTGCFMAYACMDPENMEVVTSKVKEILSEPLAFDNQDLERAKNKVISRAVLNGELPMGRLMALGTEWLLRERIHRLEDDIERLKAVTKDDVEKALGKYPLRQWSEFRLVG